jgi:hypothetical protein
MVLPTLLGEYHLTFDNRTVTEADLKPLVILSPPGRLEQHRGRRGWSAAWWARPVSRLP